MKIHLNKVEGTEKSGLFKTVKVHELFVRFELNEEEMAIYKTFPDIAKITVFPYTYKGTDLSPTANMLVNRSDDKGMRLVAYNSSELIELENLINESAPKLKAHIMSLQNPTGSTVKEI